MISQPIQNAPINNSTVSQRAAILLQNHQLEIWTRTDRLFAGLLGFEWLAGIALALWRSPRTWTGAISHVHPHVWAAIFLGGLIIALPVCIAIARPGRTLTRHVIAAGQLLMSGLLIHLGDGRIEMHFQIFGSLAFIAFYRDWKVLITATLIVAADHLLRGIYLPESVYGVVTASIWRTLEHAGWVIFEDLFLITSCIQGVTEMRGIAEKQALLEQSYRDVEEKVIERTRQLKDAQQDLMKVARSAGMAEIATSVLHNVGNVLNSVNVSASVVADKLRQSELSSLAKVGDIFREHKPDLANFLTSDERGKLIPDFLTDLALCLGEEQKTMLAEVTTLASGIEHIKQIVSAQQSLAKRGNLRTSVEPVKLVETALMMQSGNAKINIEIVKRFEAIPAIPLDEHKVLQILINLITNARQAVKDNKTSPRQISIAIARVKESDGAKVRFQITDNGAGIASEHLTRIFSHGFTTKKEGHGFGLHSAANAAKEMGGALIASSAGYGKGATFTLELPYATKEAGEACPV
jgi:signal transduction histidine kinase